MKALPNTTASQWIEPMDSLLDRVDAKREEAERLRREKIERDSKVVEFSSKVSTLTRDSH